MMSYNSAEQLMAVARERHIRLCDAVLLVECELQEKSADDIRQQIKDTLDIMYEGAQKGRLQEIYSLSGFVGGNAYRMEQYNNSGQSFCGETVIRAITMALSCSEINASMGKIVAVPTAGACGILPGALFAAGEKIGADAGLLIDALLTACGVGNIIASKATLSGAEGGCQAECGSAAAMAAAAVVQLVCDTIETPFEAAALVLKNIMGLVCDPVAGLVEIPCIKRNGIGAVNALTCADMALGGITSAIPFDEVVDAMCRVGRTIPMELRETSLGGLATTKTARLLEKKLKCQ